MSYVNDGTRFYLYDGKPQLSSSTIIATAERRLASKKQALEDMQNEFDLIEKQAFFTYKDQIFYAIVHMGFIKGATDWIKMLKDGVDKEGKKLDGRRKYNEKQVFELLTTELSKYLGIDDMKINEICDYNYGEGNHIYFTSHNHGWELEIPIVKNVQLRSYQYNGASCFKLVLLHQDSEHCFSSVGSTFEENELANFMAQGIAKYCT